MWDMVLFALFGVLLAWEMFHFDSSVSASKWVLIAELIVAVATFLMYGFYWPVLVVLVFGNAGVNQWAFSFMKNYLHWPWNCSTSD